MIVANRHTLGYVAEQLSAVLKEEQITALCTWYAGLFGAAFGVSISC
jgi:hypothetical protein